jgi:thiamine biosynthesis lipoprotein ApbE
MTQVTVDNQPVTVLLGDNETYTPATGSIQDVRIATASSEEVRIDDGSQLQTIIEDRSGGGEANTDSISVVIDDSITVSDGSRDANAGVYISGFEVN